MISNIWRIETSAIFIFIILPRQARGFFSGLNFTDPAPRKRGYFFMSKESPLIIAGPCSAESRQQVVKCTDAMLVLEVPVLRIPLWKPRTKPGFEGVGVLGIPWFAEVTKKGIIAATEVLLPKHVTCVIEGVAQSGGDPKKVLPWVGARNQNHEIQREIAEAMKDTPEEVRLLIKNQPWNSEDHWLGIVDHVTSTNIPIERIVLCHRGFAPGRTEENPLGLRNLPDWEMAMRVKQKTGLPMIIDLSHIGGTVENVFRIVDEARAYPFD